MAMYGYTVYDKVLLCMSGYVCVAMYVYMHV